MCVGRRGKERNLHNLLITYGFVSLIHRKCSKSWMVLLIFSVTVVFTEESFTSVSSDRVSLLKLRFTGEKKLVVTQLRLTGPSHLSSLMTSLCSRSTLVSYRP